MSFFSNLFGGAAAQPIEAVGNVLNSLFTSDEERLDKKIIMQRLALQPALAQVELNKVEAQHRSIFVAGWRPFIGWVCGVALAYSFVFRDIVAWIIISKYPDVQLPPELAMEHLLTILMALLGLGGLRTAEKMNGRSK